MRLEAFERIDLDERHPIFVGRLPEALRPPAERFEELWALRPDRFHELSFFGKRVPTPRWQQAFGRDYRYSGGTNVALPLPPLLEPYLAWGRTVVDRRLDGLLANWYDRALGHHIGKHRDSVDGLVEGAPIVTLSLGERRTFRLRPWRGSGFRDLAAEDGAVFVMPFATNLAWTHELRRERPAPGRRISVTLRAFRPAAGEDVGAGARTYHR